MVELDERKIPLKSGSEQELLLDIGQLVYHLDAISKNLKKGEIIRKCLEPNSYMVHAENGNMYRKTGNHLKMQQI